MLANRAALAFEQPHNFSFRFALSARSGADDKPSSSLVYFWFIFVRRSRPHRGKNIVILSINGFFMSFFFPPQAVFLRSPST
jgi:hypothetical protein